MEDASFLASLPDDINELKRLLVAREEQHRVTIAGHENTIATLTQQRDEYYIEKLRLEVRLAKALKQAYGPRADRVRASASSCWASPNKSMPCRSPRIFRTISLVTTKPRRKHHRALAGCACAAGGTSGRSTTCR